jgi:hypothetical protein
MSPISIAAVFLASTCAAAAIGLIAQRLLPEHHLSSETKDTVRLAIGTITAMTALILGLATASAKNTFDLACRNVNESAVDLITIDRMLKRYGEEAADIRADVEQMIRRRLDWLADMGKGKFDNYDPLTSASWIEDAADRIHGLEPRDVRQKGIKDQLVKLVEAALRARWALAAEQYVRMPTLFLLAVGLWLVVTFLSYGLFAGRNATVILALFLCALSVSSAIFLILEMERPFSGVVRINSDGLRRAEETFGK